MYGGGATFEPGIILRGELECTTHASVHKRGGQPRPSDPLATEVYVPFDLKADILDRMRSGSKDGGFEEHVVDTERIRKY